MIKDLAIALEEEVDADEVAVQPKKAYHSHLIEFMEFTSGMKFAKDQTFTPKVMRQIKPSHIVDWMHYKAYHNSGPSGSTSSIH